MTEFSWRSRAAALAQFGRETFDVLIVGGGITGAGLALDAVARGLRVALVEKRDFAAGTSSRSTKLIHGGLRYLEHFEFSLVREGLRERALLLKNAPHLVEPLPFLIPIYADARRNYDRPLKMRAGLWLYDFLAAGYHFGRHRRLGREEALRLAPQLDADGLQGAFLYQDARTDDARLVIEIIKTAYARGAAIANYATVSGWITEANAGQPERIVGARLRDEVTGAEFSLRARIIINATGVWLEEIGKNRISKAEVSHSRADSQRRSAAPGRQVRPSKGVHITVARERLRVEAACLIPALTGHRFYFVVPWQGRVNIGTTDTDYQGDKDAPRALAQEVAEILDAINAYFPEARLRAADVISSWAGLRPLISAASAQATTAVSRKEEIIESANGLLAIAGGKLTTYRLMAERAMAAALRQLRTTQGFVANTGQPQTSTADIRIGGGAFEGESPTAFAERLAASANLTTETARHLTHAYGAAATQVVELARENGEWSNPLIAGLPHLLAEVVYAARCEMAITPADVLARRLRLLVLAGREALAIAPTVAALMAAELGWSDEERQHHLEQLSAEFAGEYTIGEGSRE